MAALESISDVATVTRVAMKPPSKFNVVLHNDDGTTFEFVILVLTTIFHKSINEATAITMHIHDNGKGAAGTYGHEIAVQKRDETISVARANNYPLRCTIEEA